MSFKLFIYYCAVCGGLAAFAGWGLGQVLIAPLPDTWSPVFRAVLLGLSLGMMVAAALGVVDVLGNSGSGQLGQALLKGAVVAVIGAVAGLFGALVGQALVSLTGVDLLFPLGWVLTGLLIGASVGLYDVAGRLLQGQGFGGAVRKLINGLLGGFLGGVLGSILYAALGLVLGAVVGFLSHKASDDLKSTSAWGFVAVGVFIGLFIGLAQVILKEAWVKVESGFRAGRELLLTQDAVTIGRAESCDIGLFGDNTIERTHARIVVKNGRYLVEDTGTPAGTYVNDERIGGPTVLRSGDEIRVGKSVLRFGERQKRK